MEERKREEERVVPSESNPDALRKKREGGAEEGNQTLFKHHVNLSISKVRGHLGRRATSRMRKKKRNPASKESRGLREKAQGGLPDGALAFFNKLG